ncbi:hypothetical protein GCM10008983_14770 [Lentibacillus halophilus]|uniref:Tripartite ATP-independent periplasmic transporters DctQ component domain-containing protein n=1 Tax=Lentibacillus halophilus TaxID=295065 RepID=A0ABN0Z9S5_9BACI
MKLYKHLDDHIETYLSAALLVFFSLLCIVQVIMRYVFNESLIWSEELSRYAFVWFIYTSAAYAVRYQRHVKFSFLVTLLHKASPMFSQLLKILALIIWISFLIFLDYFSIQLVLNQYHTGQVSPANQLPMYMVYIGIPIGSFLMTFRVVQHIIRDVNALKTVALNNRK